MQGFKEGIADNEEETRTHLEELTGPEFTQFLYSDNCSRDRVIAGLKGRHQLFNPGKLMSALSSYNNSENFSGIFPEDRKNLQRFIDRIKSLTC